MLRQHGLKMIAIELFDSFIKVLKGLASHYQAMVVLSHFLWRFRLGDVSNYSSILAYFLQKVCEIMTIEILPIKSLLGEHKNIVILDGVKAFDLVFIDFLVPVDILSFFSKE